MKLTKARLIIASLGAMLVAGRVSVKGADGTGKEALDAAKRYNAAVGEYRSHLSDPEYLRDALKAALDVRDDSYRHRLGNAFCDCLKEPYAKDDLVLLAKAVRDSKDKGFSFFLANRERVTEVMGNDSADRLLHGIIYDEEIQPVVKVAAAPPEWVGLAARVNAKYPRQAGYVVALGKIRYFKEKSPAAEYRAAVGTFMKEYCAVMNDSEINEYAWAMFKDTVDKGMLLAAASWCRQAIDRNPDIDGNFIDTYAELLYKAGDTQGGIGWETKAIAKADASGDTADSRKFRKALDLMRTMQPGDEWTKAVVKNDQTG